jgi:hypothetical protein
MWQQCSIPENAARLSKVIGQVSAPAQTSISLSNNDINTTDLLTPQNLAAANAATLGSVSLSNGVVRFEGSTSPTSAPPVVARTETGGAADVAKYIVRGLVNTDILTNAKDRQNFELTIYNNLDPTRPPPAPFVIEDTNLFLAGKFQINPGQVPKWQVSDYFIKEVTTTCKQIPFVNAPKQIGSNENQDFAIQPIFGRTASRLAGETGEKH